MKDVSKNSISLRIKEIRNSENISQGLLAKQLNVTRGVIANIETGVSGLTADIAEGLITHFNINASWLYTGTGSMHNTNVKNIDIFNNHKPNVIFYEINASAGGLIAAQQDSEIINEWFIPDLIGEHIAINVLGQSMSPTINEGDKIVAKECFRNDLKDGRIYIVVTTDNNVRVKRLRMNSEVMMLWADNIAHQPRFEKLLPDEIVRIFHVVMVCKTLAY